MKLKFYSFSMFVAMLMMASTTFAQITDPSTAEFNSVPATLSYYADYSALSGVGRIDAQEIGSTGDGSWVEYKIQAAAAGDFNVTLSLSSARVNPAMQVYVYTEVDVDSNPVPMSSTTLPIVSSGWNDKGDYVFPISLEANVTYTLRCTFTNAGGNMYGIDIATSQGSVDATLSDLLFGVGTATAGTIEGFVSTTVDYEVTVAEGTTQVTLDAVVNDANATLTSGTGTFDVASGVNVLEILVTAEDTEVTQVYAVTVRVPGTVDVPSVIQIGGHIYASNGIGDVRDNELGSIRGGDNYAEYMIQAAEAGEYTLKLNHGTGTENTIINVDTYLPGEVFVLNSVIDYTIPSDKVTAYDDKNVVHEFNFSLEENTPTIIRITYSVLGSTSAWCGNTWAIEVIKALSTSSIAEEANELTVIGGQGKVTVLCDDSFVNGTVEIYTLSGSLVAKQEVASTNNVYTLGKSGLYIVKVSAGNVVETAKCVVK